MANKPLGFPFGFFTNDNTPIDGKYFNRETLLPYSNMAEALSLLPIGIRYKGLTINIAGVEYWWKPDTSDLSEDPVIKEVDLSGYQLLSEKSQPNGYASLDSNGTIPISELPDSLFSSMKYGGGYDGVVITASASFPELEGQPLPDPTLYEGLYLISTADYTYNGVDYFTGDWILSNGVEWTIVRNTDAVRTVFGRTGDVVITPADLNLSVTNQVPFRNASGNFQAVSMDQATGNASLARRTGTGTLKATNAVANDDLVPLGQLNTLIANKPNKQTVTLSQADLLQDTNNIWYLPYDYTEDIVPVHILYNNKTLLGWQVDRTFTPARLYGFIDNSTATIKLTLI